MYMYIYIYIYTYTYTYRERERWSGFCCVIGFICYRVLRGKEVGILGGRRRPPPPTPRPPQGRPCMPNPQAKPARPGTSREFPCSIGEIPSSKGKSLIPKGSPFREAAAGRAQAQARPPGRPVRPGGLARPAGAAGRLTSCCEGRRRGAGRRAQRWILMGFAGCLDFDWIC